MYLNHDKKNTKIDDEFENDNLLSTVLSIINKYKILIIIGLILVIVIPVIYIYINQDRPNYIVLAGEQTITIYQNSEYIEPGYKAYNYKDEDITNTVSLTSNIDTSKIGTYEINYTIGDITKTRIISVIEKPKEYTYIYLKSIYNEETVYLKRGEEYKEPGYKVFNTTGIDLTDKLKVTGNIDNNKAGTYKLIYSVIDNNNVTTTATRLVVVLDADINLTLTPSDYTNKEVTININIIDNYFDYIILPNNQKITTKTYQYKVTENGRYTFKTYNKKGHLKEESIEIKTIDRTPPTGSCQLDQNTNGSFITINANDNIEIQKYIHNNKVYTNNRIDLNTFETTAKITIYDKANNTKEINCTVVPKVYISSIEKDGVIVTVNAKKVNNDITGYYFSYTDKRPDKKGGYIETNKEKIDVVRLPGTTYVWVEDSSGKISEYKTIQISNSALLDTSGSKYTILKNKRLDTFLKEKGWSIEGLNNLMYRSVRAAGLYSNEAAATSAVSLLTVLAQKYKIKLPYWWGGKYWDLGADPTWGKYKTTSNGDMLYEYFGLDCSGFVAWTYVMAGYNVGNSDRIYPRFWYVDHLKYSKSNGNIGDYLISSGHIRLIIGKTNDSFITAEAQGKQNGMIITKYKFSKANGYEVGKSSKIMSDYKKISTSKYPKGY